MRKMRKEYDPNTVTRRKRKDVYKRQPQYTADRLTHPWTICSRSCAATRKSVSPPQGDIIKSE